jgi:hypothetical protein
VSDIVLGDIERIDKRFEGQEIVGPDELYIIRRKLMFDGMSEFPIKEGFLEKFEDFNEFFILWGSISAFCFFL